jgi:hypothetical protein
MSWALTSMETARTFGDRTFTLLSKPASCG